MVVRSTLRRVGRPLAAVVAGVGAERTRFALSGQRPLSRRVAVATSLVLVVWGNGLVLLSRAAGDGYRELVTLVGQVVGVTCVLTFLVGSRHFSAAELGWRPTRLQGPALKVVILAAALVVLAVMGIAVRRGHCDADGGVALNVARLLVATALGEEVLFRGVLLAVWSRTTAADRTLVAANCVVFALWHVVGGFKGGTFHPTSVLVPAVGALWFLWTRCRFSSVVAAAVPHATTNVPTWLLANCR